ncbi:Mitogen-activated protein kinase kinase kinase 2 [Diplonema papillatum]|nr:Mitogen-activated protein kinase kinase kinase 2 [Diplonema papillatum]
MLVLFLTCWCFISLVAAAVMVLAYSDQLVEKAVVVQLGLFSFGELVVLGVYRRKSHTKGKVEAVALAVLLLHLYLSASFFLFYFGGVRASAGMAFLVLIMPFACFPLVKSFFADQGSLSPASSAAVTPVSDEPTVVVTQQEPTEADAKSAITPGLITDPSHSTMIMSPPCTTLAHQSTRTVSCGPSDYDVPHFDLRDRKPSPMPVTSAAFQSPQRSPFKDLSLSSTSTLMKPVSLTPRRKHSARRQRTEDRQKRRAAARSVANKVRHFYAAATAVSLAVLVVSSALPWAREDDGSVHGRMPVPVDIIFAAGAVLLVGEFQWLVHRDLDRRSAATRRRTAAVRDFDGSSDESAKNTGSLDFEKPTNAGVVPNLAGEGGRPVRMVEPLELSARRTASTSLSSKKLGSACDRSQWRRATVRPPRDKSHLVTTGVFECTSAGSGSACGGKGQVRSVGLTSDEGEVHARSVASPGVPKQPNANPLRGPLVMSGTPADFEGPSQTPNPPADLPEIAGPAAYPAAKEAKPAAAAAPNAAASPESAAGLSASTQTQTTDEMTSYQLARQRPPPTKLPPNARYHRAVIAASEPMKKTLNWRKGDLIGQGAFGRVHIGLNTETGQLMAVKTVEFSAQDPAVQQKMRQLQNEIEIMKPLDHVHIVRYFFTERTGLAINIFMEYVSGGSLLKVLKSFGPLSEATLINYTGQILSGLEHLHMQGVVHRDIKSANVLLTVNGYIKLADFGASALFSRPCPGGMTNKNLNNVKNSSAIALMGTPYWMAPEILAQTHESNWEADIWSLGCTVMEMVTAKHPWEHLGRTQWEVLQLIVKTPDVSALLPRRATEATRGFLLDCLRHEPEDRPTAALLLEHHYLMSTPRQSMRDESITTVSSNSVHRTRSVSSIRESLQSPRGQFSVASSLPNSRHWRHVVQPSLQRADSRLKMSVGVDPNDDLESSNSDMTTPDAGPAFHRGRDGETTPSVMSLDAQNA